MRQRDVSKLYRIYYALQDIQSRPKKPEDVDSILKELRGLRETALKIKSIPQADALLEGIDDLINAITSAKNGDIAQAHKHLEEMEVKLNERT